jgi:hypothetical protein
MRPANEVRLTLSAILRVVGRYVTLITGRIGDSLRTGISAAIQVIAKTDVQAIFVQHPKPTLGLAKVQLLSASRIGAEVPVESKERWFGRFGQADKQLFCLAAAKVPRTRSKNNETSTADAQLRLYRTRLSGQ